MFPLLCPSGCMSVPLFNQKKRSRVPLTSAPSENEFFFHSEYNASSSSAAPHSSSDSELQVAEDAIRFPSENVHLDVTRPQFRPLVLHKAPSGKGRTSQSAPPPQYVSNRPAPGPSPPIRAFKPIAHPYKVGGTSSQMGQPSNPGRLREFSPGVNSTPMKPTPHSGFSPMAQQSSYRPLTLNNQYPKQPRPLPAPVPPPSRPSAPLAAQPQNKSWNFTSSFGPQRLPFEGNSSTIKSQAARQTHNQDKFAQKTAFENSLRILTSVINGMRHWSQFKDKVPYLFEIFATLDSAVTLGRHGAKNFLMRDGKAVVQCVFYETEQELPRLIRGQVHRCVGNYDRSRDVLMCVSVRPGLPSELRNAQEAVKACDAEMRGLVKLLSEV
ncbi:hypothetical protein F7725_007185 [Dissostichus mawsoni]|uniref:Spermatogenesis associated 22 n=1 Tax=Dissostichus mawsoni TaxID=36200 RepID=A0A7J5XX26_DISMA|nr:hypothetical protein F7725_007185 [Dissostichus mawsoni]